MFVNYLFSEQHYDKMHLTWNPVDSVLAGPFPVLNEILRSAAVKCLGLNFDEKLDRFTHQKRF